MLRHKGTQKIKLCRDMSQLCHDIKNCRWQISFFATKDNYAKTQNSKSALKGKKTLWTKKFYVATKTFIVVVKVEKNYKTNVAMQKSLP